MAFITPSALPIHPRTHTPRIHLRPVTTLTSRRRHVVATLDSSRISQAQQVLSDLLDSNTRYVAGQADSQEQLSPPSLRKQLAQQGQKPMTAVVTCADSRVAPEIVFGKGIGELFVIRNAGNVVWEDSVVASLEFACGVLGVCLVVVLGHSRCGAVKAAVGGDDIDGVLGRFVGKLRGVVQGIGEAEEAVEKNVRDGVARLKEGGGVVGDLVKKGEVTVVGGIYDVESGEVRIVEGV